jgi:hypothetical protein
MGRAKMKATIQLPSGIPRHSENVCEAKKSEEVPDQFYPLAVVD